MQPKGTMMGQIGPEPSGAEAAAQADTEVRPVAALAYAPASAEATRRVVRMLAGFTVVYGAAMLLGRAVSLLSMVYLGNGSIDWARVFSIQGMLYLGARAIEAAVLVAMIVAASALRSGRDARRPLVLACWGYIAGSAAVVLVQMGVTLFSPGWGGPGLPGSYALYWAGQNAVGLLGRVVFPLAVAGVFGGRIGEALVREGQ